MRSSTKLLLLIKISMVMMLCISFLCQPVWANVDSEGGADTKKLRVVGDNTYPPLVFINNKGQQDGYDIDFLHLLEREKINSVTIMLMDWNDAKTSVATGRADILIV
ncbi:MAG: metal dependent phosphohydrolase [Firmicutes bacterium]|nr:metal dependent phosphohydrolase [Bacillota bacterium]